MKRIRFIKYAVMAAGFILSAAFYVQIGPGVELVSPKEAEETQEEGEHIELYELRGLSERQRTEVMELIDNEIYKLRAELGYKPEQETGTKITSEEDSEQGTGDVLGAAASEAGTKAGMELKEALTSGPGGSSTSGMGQADDSQTLPLINLNTASMEELMELKGIGESRAMAIIEYRETYGGFEHIEEIMNISGIKEASFEKIKDRICV